MNEKIDLIATYWMHAGNTKPVNSQEWSPWDFENRLEMLNEVGFNGIGIYHADLEYMLKQEGQTLRSINKLLDEYGMEYIELEFLINWMFPEDDYRRQNEQDRRKLLLEAADEFDARHIKAGNIEGYPVSTSQLSSAFEQLCTEAAEINTNVGMEILPPDPNATTIEEALEWVRGPDNGGLLLDMWHINNIDGISYDDISNLDADDIVAVELGDGFTNVNLGFRERTVNFRRTLGNGGFDIDGFINAVRNAGFNGPWGNEILSEEYRRIPMENAYPRVYDNTMSFLK